MIKKLLFIIFLAFGFIGSGIANDFKVAFEWGDLKICNTGNPNIVKNPIFEISNVPDGTKWIHFKMTDLNVPSYNHGGGWVEYTGINKIESGVFTYKSPCPPGRVHKYQWTATAKKEKSTFGGKLATASASRNYP
jgi:phosphatidylethanolamine-binding protein (PEBP) family uncharacterized protein